MRPWTELLFSWLPMLFFIGVWFYFMRKNPFWKQSDYYERRQRHLDKVEELLGRIATALERR